MKPMAEGKKLARFWLQWSVIGICKYWIVPESSKTLGKLGVTLTTYYFLWTWKIKINVLRTCASHLWKLTRIRCLSRASQSREFWALPRNRWGRISTGKPGSANGSISLMGIMPPNCPVNPMSAESRATLSSSSGGSGSDSRPSRSPTLKPKLKPEPNSGGPTSIPFSSSTRISPDSKDESGRSSSESEADRDPSEPGRRLFRLSGRTTPAVDLKPSPPMRKLGRTSLGLAVSDSRVTHHSGYLFRNSSTPPNEWIINQSN